MPRIRLIIEYDGTNYRGWQNQPNGLAVQEVLERELEKLTGERIVIHASGRTDSGVHARAQVAHFDTLSSIPADKFCYALNVGLPADVRIIYSDSVYENFHARFCVKKKHYRYAIWHAPHASALNARTTLHIHTTLDYDNINVAAKDIIGTHDFRAFKAAGVELNDTVRTIYESNWSVNGRLVTYDVIGSGFMYNMVRILVGTMIEIGQGRRDKDSLKTALSTLNRSDAGATAPAHGLMLMGVEYADGFNTRDYV